ncbi:hypothetical protein D3OALGA1CA_1045 [Olavius algarvensis associated proteobacterium Delta 3]|nr:hypothetical protein D3OALGA1CA_1045 [Olavius algarvensis associated proteobacterium Delta 3]CAB5131036.1 hypothetical protein D3OALGB2SA_3635 [Olavius algarvensis associated proteobacterium Delta 3]
MRRRQPCFDADSDSDPDTEYGRVWIRNGIPTLAKIESE